MKNIELLEKLKDIAKLVKNYSSKDKELEKLDDLILNVEGEILKESYEGKTPKQRIDYAIKWHKKQLKTTRPILAYSCKDQVEGYQVFTDCYFMIFLNENDFLPIPDYKEYANGKVNFPNTLQLYKSIECGEEIKLDIKKIQSLLKIKNEIYTSYKNNKLYFNKKRFDDLLVLLNVKNNDNIKILIDNQILKFIKNDNNKAIMIVGAHSQSEINIDFEELLIKE